MCILLENDMLLICCSSPAVPVLIRQVKIWFQNRRMKWRNCKERELLANGGSRAQTLPTRNNPHPDLTDAITLREHSPVLAARADPLSELSGGAARGDAAVTAAGDRCSEHEGATTKGDSPEVPFMRVDSCHHTNVA